MANNIITYKVEDPSSPPWPKVVIKDLDEVTMDLEETMSMSTPRYTIGFNEVNEPLMELGSIQYIQNKVS